MPRYYFDVDDGTDLILDQQGIECGSLDEMRYEAVDALPDLARAELPDGDNRTMTVKVRDAAGKYLLEASLTVSVRWLGNVD
jgi:hypothetical protein